jgi:2'-5' RNA ligase
MRLFVALWPPDHVVRRLETLHRKDQRGVRFVDPDRWHVTLRFLGDADPDEVGDALDGGRFATATVDLGPGVDLLGDRLVVVPARGADPLAAEVARVTRGLGSEPLRPRFRGHVTLARLQRRAQLPRILGHHVEASWVPTELALVASTLRPDHVRYETIARWPVPTDGQTGR